MTRAARFSDYVIALFLLIGLFAGLSANAQSQPSLTFEASQTEGIGSLAPSLFWDAPGASSCTASGHSSWSGTKPASGNVVLPAITLHGEYTLTLSCSWPSETDADLSWVNPTTNTDGTALTDRAGSRVLYGPAADTLSQVINIPNTSATSYTVENLTPGTWYFAVKAYTSGGVESSTSNVVSKVIGPAQSAQGSVALTVVAVPSAPTDLSVQ